MKAKYRVLINGQNFLLKIEGTLQKTGFYATRFVETQNEYEAETLAIEEVRRDPKLSAAVANQPDDSPVLHVDEVEKVDELKPPLGYAFYSEEDPGCAV